MASRTSTECEPRAVRRSGSPATPPKTLRLAGRLTGSASCSTRVGAEGTNRRDVFVVNADGSGLQQVTSDPRDESYGRWMSDGRLAFLSENGPMVTEQTSDHHWSEPTKDTLTGRATPFGRLNRSQDKDGLILRNTGAPDRVVATAATLHGHIGHVESGPDPAIAFVRTVDSTGVHALLGRCRFRAGSPRLAAATRQDATCGLGAASSRPTGVTSTSRSQRPGVMSRCGNGGTDSDPAGLAWGWRGSLCASVHRATKAGRPEVVGVRLVWLPVGGADNVRAAC